MGLGWLLLALGLAALAFAAIFGGREERIFVLAQAASGLAGHSAVRFGHDITRPILLDLAVLAILLPLALRSSRIWPLVVASVCVASLMTVAAQLLVHASPQAYAIIHGTWDLLADFVVAFGAWNYWRARRGSKRLAAADTKTPGPRA
ncbi:hypothetical protein LJR225_002094 [Phenylobacterium sp. LjRoot225]|uniref:hypothetical protein n=1 Tax=Phenylobacterium sp. LjRoot225 TaxID=3342285 RepID=UPI003ECDFBE5